MLSFSSFHQRHFVVCGSLSFFLSFFASLFLTTSSLQQNRATFTQLLQTPQNPYYPHAAENTYIQQQQQQYLWNNYHQQQQSFVNEEEEEEDEEEENRDEGSVGEEDEEAIEELNAEEEEGEEEEEEEEEEEGDYMGEDGQLVLSEAAIEFFAQSEMRRQEREDSSDTLSCCTYMTDRRVALSVCVCVCVSSRKARAAEGSPRKGGRRENTKA